MRHETNQQANWLATAIYNSQSDNRHSGIQTCCQPIRVTYKKTKPASW